MTLQDLINETEKNNCLISMIKTIVEGVREKGISCMVFGEWTAPMITNKCELHDVLEAILKEEWKIRTIKTTEYSDMFIWSNTSEDLVNSCMVLMKESAPAAKAIAEAEYAKAKREKLAKDSVWDLLVEAARNGDFGDVF